jgi:hypothetical protein
VAFILFGEVFIDCVFLFYYFFSVRLIDWNIVVVILADGAGICVCCWFRVFKDSCGWLRLLGWRDGL